MSITSYLKETRLEISQITWPTLNQAILFTVAVIVVSLVVGYFLGFFDFIFSLGLTKLLQIR
jgi:preprotein translocase SecE subunit